MSVSAFSSPTLSTILCCVCGTPIPSNPANMCVNCIRGQVDITEGIPKHVSIYWCRGCGRYLSPPNNWLICESESRELLTFCVKKIKGLSKVKLVDASWVWTEPHSKRLKVKLTIQKEVFKSTILQQIFIVEFVVHGQQCTKCKRTESKDTWNALIQVRQRVGHKRTFYFLEQTILKHNAHAQTLQIKENSEGVDFYFGHKSHAMKMLDFMHSVVPIKTKSSDHLVSHDAKSNIYNYKYTFAVELATICREDLVCLPLRLAYSLGLLSPFALITRISNVIRLLDPLTLKTTEIHASEYWKTPFKSLATRDRLQEYTVLDITLSGERRGKYQLAEATVARTADLGVNDNIFVINTHLGTILTPGCLALGYDLLTSNFNDDEYDNAVKKKVNIPEIILVKKSYSEARRRKKRNFKLKHIVKGEGEEKEYEQFLEDLEEDDEMRANVVLYKKEKKEEDTMTDTATEDGDEGDYPQIPLDELVDGMESMNIQADGDENEEDEEFEDVMDDEDEENEDQ